MATRDRLLRTSLPQNPLTQGERIRHARIASNLSQAQLSRAVKSLTRKPVVKGTVSKWESGVIASPGADDILAIEAVTGFSAKWLVSGTGTPRAPAVREHQGIDANALHRALQAVMPATDIPTDALRAAAVVYELVLDSPGVSDDVLQRTAKAIIGNP